MPAITDFSELVLAVGEHINRNDIVDVMPRLVSMAEAKLNRVLRFRDQETSVTLTPDVNGVVTLPTNFLEARSVVTTGNPPIILRAMGEDNANREYIPGEPKGYMLDGANMLILPASQVPVRLNYFAAIPELETATNQQNWLLTKYPDIYLYAVVFEACVYVGDTQRAQASDALTRAAIDSASRFNTMSRVAQSRFRFARRVP